MQKDGLKKYVILRPFGDAARGLISFLKQKGREVEDACARGRRRRRRRRSPPALFMQPKLGRRRKRDDDDRGLYLRRHLICE